MSDSAAVGGLWLLLGVVVIVGFWIAGCEQRLEREIDRRVKAEERAALAAEAAAAAKVDAKLAKSEAAQAEARADEAERLLAKASGRHWQIGAAVVGGIAVLELFIIGVMGGRMSKSNESEMQMRSVVNRVLLAHERQTQSRELSCEHGTNRNRAG